MQSCFLVGVTGEILQGIIFPFNSRRKLAWSHGTLLFSKPSRPHRRDGVGHPLRVVPAVLRGRVAGGVRGLRAEAEAENGLMLCQDADRRDETLDGNRVVVAGQVPVLPLQLQENLLRHVLQSWSVACLVRPFLFILKSLVQSLHRCCWLSKGFQIV